MIAPVFSLRTVTPAVEEAFGAAWIRMRRKEPEVPMPMPAGQGKRPHTVDDMDIHERRAEVYKRLDQGMTAAEIAADLGVRPSTVYNDIERRHVATRNDWRKRERARNLVIVKEVYDRGGAMREMVEATGRSSDTIKGYLTDLGIVLRNRGIYERRDKIRALHGEGLTYAEISRQVGCAVETVRRDCKALGLPTPVKPPKYGVR